MSHQRISFFWFFGSREKHGTKKINKERKNDDDEEEEGNNSELTAHSTAQSTHTQQYCLFGSMVCLHLSSAAHSLAFDNWLMKFPFSDFQLNVKRVSLSEANTHTHTTFVREDELFIYIQSSSALTWRRRWWWWRWQHWATTSMLTHMQARNK